MAGYSQINIYPSNTDFKSCEIFYCISYMYKIGVQTTYQSHVRFFIHAITYASIAHDTDARAFIYPVHL